MKAPPRRLVFFLLFAAAAPLVRLELRCPRSVQGRVEALSSEKCNRRWTLVWPWWRILLPKSK